MAYCPDGTTELLDAIDNRFSTKQIKSICQAAFVKRIRTLCSCRYIWSHKHPFKSLLLVLCLIAFSREAFCQERWLENVTEAKVAASQNQFREADALFEKALREAESFGENDPRLTASLRLSAKFYSERKNFERAILLLKREQAIQSKLGEDFPGRVSGMIALGECFIGIKSFDKAEQQLLHALRLAPAVMTDDWKERSLNALYQCYTLQGAYRKALPCARQLVSHLENKTGIQPSDLYQAHYLLALTCYRNQLYKEALDVQQRNSQQSTQTYVWAYSHNRLQAEIYAAMNQGDLALIHYKRTIDSIKNVPSYWDNVYSTFAEWSANAKTPSSSLAFEKAAREWEVYLKTRPEKSAVLYLKLLKPLLAKHKSY